MAGIDGHEAILLPHKMKDGHVGEHPPKDKRADHVQQHSAEPHQQGRVGEQIAVAIEFRRIQICAPQCAVDVGHVHTDDQEQPCLRRHRGVVYEEAWE